MSEPSVTSDPAGSDQELPRDEKPTDGAGGAWMVASRVLGLASQFGLMLVAARFLSPAQFGLYTLISSTALIASSAARSGWMECVMTARDELDRVQSNMLALGAGLIAMSLGLLTSFVQAAFSDDTIANQTAFTLALSLLPASVSAPQHGALMAARQVRKLGQAQIAAELLGLAAGAVCLSLHWGMLSLAVAKLTSEGVSCVLLIAATRWYPIARLEWTVCTRLLGIWKSFASACVMSLLSASGSVYLLGAFAGAADTGVFRAGVRFSGVVNELITEPARVTYWGNLKAAHDRGGQAAIASAAVSLSATTMLLGAPLAVGLAATADTVVATALGETWKNAAPVVALTALAILPRLPTFPGLPVLALTGNDRLVPKLTLWNSIASLVCMACTVPFGAIWVSIGSLLGSLIFLPICVWIWGVVPELRWRDLWKRYLPILTAALVMGAAVRALPRLLTGLPSAWVLLVQVMLGAAVYVGAIAVLSPQDLKNVIALTPHRGVKAWVHR